MGNNNQGVGCFLAQYEHLLEELRSTTTNKGRTKVTCFSERCKLLIDYSESHQTLAEGVP